MQTLGDLLPEKLLEKMGYVPSNGKTQSETHNDNLVFVPLAQFYIGEDSFHAFDKKFVIEERMDKRSALVAVPEKLAIKDNLNHPKVPRKVLLEHGWVSETGVLSHYSNKDLMEKYAQFFIVNDKWRFNRRFEIFGPRIDRKGVIELQPGIYYLNLPKSEIGKSALELGVSIEEFNKGKNAFRHPNMKKARELQYERDAGWQKPTDEVMLEAIGRENYAQRMELFFRKHPDGPKPLYLMRPCKAGVIDFINLHKEAVFDEEKGKINVPKGHLGYWIGKKGDFIGWLSEFYGSKLEVRVGEK